MPGHFSADVRIDKFACFASHHHPPLPHSAQRTTIRAGFDLIGAIARHQHSSVGKFQKRRQRWINLLDWIGKTRQPMRRGQVISHAWLSAGYDWEGEVNRSLTDQPNSRRPGAVTKKLKPGQIRPHDVTG